MPRASRSQCKCRGLIQARKELHLVGNRDRETLRPACISLGQEYPARDRSVKRNEPRNDLHSTVPRFPHRQAQRLLAALQRLATQPLTTENCEL